MEKTAHEIQKERIAEIEDKAAMRGFRMSILSHLNVLS